MTEDNNLLDLAITYHEALPRNIRCYLNNKRGIPDEIIDRHILGWNGWRITIPIFDRGGDLAFFKLAKDPDDRGDSPKMLATPGSHVELYGWDEILNRPSEIVICEGEFDRLVLEAKGLPAATSTGGAGTFRSEWAVAFASIPGVYICLDRDEAGRSGAMRVGQMIRHAKVVELPEEVGEGGDITDLFVQLGWTADDFRRLVEAAKPAPPPPDHITVAYQPMPYDRPFDLTDRIMRIKNELAIADVVGQYATLRGFGSYLTGCCPFHEDHNPSLAVYPGTRTFHCFGCGKHGDVITFVKEIERLSFADTLDVLDRFKSSHESGNQTHR
jgi:DNA primase